MSPRRTAVLESRVVKQTGLVNFFERKHDFLGWQAGFVCVKAKK
jgi:hypothetical protein